jgi:hypothetical protein
VSDIRITTAGLGRATLGQESGSALTDCATALPDERPLFHVASLPTGGIRLRVRIPTESVTQLGTSLDGKIIATVPSYDALEFPMKVTHMAGAGATTMAGFVGILIPALLTAAIAYLGTKATTALASDRKDREEFTAYKDKNFDELHRLFTQFYPTIYGSKPPDLQSLAHELRLKHIIDRIPRRARKQLEDALERSDVRGAVSALGKAFAHWRPTLEAKLEESTRGGNE